MPAYTNSPLAPSPTQLQAGKTEYLYGTYSDTTAPSKLYATNVSATTSHVTLTANLVEGAPPIVGSLITVYGAQSYAGANVTNAALTTVTLVSGNQYTLIYAVSGAGHASTADAALCIVPVPEIAETIVAGSSQAVVLPQRGWAGGGQWTIRVDVQVPSAPTALTVVLQQSLTNVDGDFQEVGSTAVLTVSSSTPTLGTLCVTGQAGMFYRLNCSGLTDSGTILGKILVQ